MAPQRWAILAVLAAATLLLLSACTGAAANTVIMANPTSAPERAASTPSAPTVSTNAEAVPPAAPAPPATVNVVDGPEVGGVDDIGPVLAAVMPAPSPPRPALPEVSPALGMEALQERLDWLASTWGLPGDIGFAVTDIITGETVGVGLDRPHLTGCSVNFFVLLQATLDVQNGLYEEELVGQRIAGTIYRSDAGTARELYEIVGGGDLMHGVQRVANLISMLSPWGSTFDHPPMYGFDSLGIDPDNLMTPAAMNHALRAVFTEGLLSPEWLDYLLDKMTVVKPGLGYLLEYGPTVPVSHKNGFFPLEDEQYWVDNDIGIVRFEQDGEQRAYAVSYFSQWVPVKFGDVGLGQQLSFAAWQFFQERYPSTGG